VNDGFLIDLFFLFLGLNVDSIGTAQFKEGGELLVLLRVGDDLGAKLFVQEEIRICEHSFEFFSYTIKINVH
jgi:hypothetical protein